MDSPPNFYSSKCLKCELEVLDMVRLDLSACPRCHALDWSPHKVIPFCEVPTAVLKAKFSREIETYSGEDAWPIDRSTSDEFDTQ